ncbi:MAG: hypothetical protein K2W82_05400 [Candidatus Obscuribacterales bacterium]|nr:hypothetical protein [Candidatus Obscuribacterales bacterium]
MNRAPVLDWVQIEKRAALKTQEKEKIKNRTAILRSSEMANKKVFFQGLFNFFHSFGWHFKMSSTLHNKMCENYGHVIEGQSWNAKGIHCRDCGKRVVSPDELRKSLPRSI